MTEGNMYLCFVKDGTGVHPLFHSPTGEQNPEAHLIGYGLGQCPKVGAHHLDYHLCGGIVASDIEGNLHHQQLLQLALHPSDMIWFIWAMIRKVVLQVFDIPEPMDKHKFGQLRWIWRNCL